GRARRFRVRDQGQPVHHAHAEAAEVRKAAGELLFIGAAASRGDAGADPLATAAAAAVRRRTRARLFRRRSPRHRGRRTMGAATLYASRYTDAELATWANHIRPWTAAGADVYVYFDNDAQGHAPHDAVRLQALLAGS